MENTELKYNNLVQRIEKVISKQKMYDSVSFIVSIIAVFVVSFSIVSLVEYFVNSDESTRQILFYIPFVITLNAGITLYFGKRKEGKKSGNKIIDTSKKVGDYFPQIKDKLTNAIQIFAQLNKSKGVSNDLAQHQLSIISDNTREYNFEDIIDTKKYNKFILLLFEA